MTELPGYQELPQIAGGGRSAWGLFGTLDNVGLVNLMTPERVVSAAGLIRKGRLFPLDMPLGSFDPALARYRGSPRHRILHRAGTAAFDDVFDNFYPQGSSQWDSLGHVGYAPDQFYNGATESQVLHGERNTIEHWSRHGIAGRAVVLDMPRAMRAAGRHYGEGEATAIGVDDLEAARKLAGVEFRYGDTILLHTGFAAWYLTQSHEVKDRLHGSVIAPGLEHSEAVCEYLWNTHASAIGSDTFAVEVFPADNTPGAGPMGFIHHILIGQFGMALGELWWLSDLANDCVEDGVYETFFVSAPLHALGGIGSPANAVAIK